LIAIESCRKRNCGALRDRFLRLAAVSQGGTATSIAAVVAVAPAPDGTGFPASALAVSRDLA
jgi:hypothetical protein